MGSRGFREKNLPTAIRMQLFGVFFSTLCGQEKSKKRNQKYFSIRTEKLLSLKANTYFKKLLKDNYELKNMLQTYSEIVL